MSDELISGITDSLVNLDERVGELERKENPEAAGIGPFEFEVNVAIDGGGDFTSVKAAADYVLATAQADEYWTIVVHAGEYAETAFELPANTSIVGVGNAFISSESLSVSGTFVTLTGNCTMRNITLTLNMNPTSADCWAVVCSGGSGYLVLENCSINVVRFGGSGSSNAIGVVKTETGDISNCWLRMRVDESGYPGTRNVVRFEDATAIQKSYLRDCTIGFATDTVINDISTAVYLTTHILYVIDCTIQKRTSGSAGYDIEAAGGGTVYTSGTLYVKSTGTVTNLDVAAGAGGVTSVGLSNSADNILAFTGSPVTSSGTIQVRFANTFAWTVLARQGTDGPPGFQSLQENHIPSLNASKITAGTLAVARGGTGIASYTVGDLIYASGATTLATRAAVATGNALISGGVATAPTWGKIGLTTHVSGILPSTNGGTGVNNAGMLTVPTDVSITGGGTLALGGFTLTAPATGTAVLGTGTAGRLVYWSDANTAASHGNLIFDPSSSPTSLTLLGLVKFGGVDAYYTGTDNALIYGSLNTGGAVPFTLSGNLILQARASAGRGIYLVTGTTSTPRMIIGDGGAVLIGRTTGLTGAGDTDINGRARADTFETANGAKWKLQGWTTNADAAIQGYVTVNIDGTNRKLATIA